MVRRLVEHEQIDFFIHEHAQPQPRLLAAGERTDGLEHVLAGEQECAEAVARRLGRAILLIEHRVIERALRVGKVNDLRQIARLDGRAELDLSLRGQLAEQHTQERRLAGAVVAEQRNALAAPHRQLHAGKQRPAAELLAEILDGEDFVAVELLFAEAGAERLLLGRPLRLLDALHAVLDGHGAAVEHAVVDAPALHALDGEAELLELGLLLLILPELMVEALLLFLEVEAVVAAVELGLACGYFNDALHDLIEEIAVMRDRQDRSLEVTDVVLQPLHAAQVQMVRRLVEQQDVRLLEQQARQVHARLFAAGQAVEFPAAHFGRDAKAVTDLVDFRVLLIAAARQIGVAQAVIFAQIRSGSILFERFFQFLHPALQRGQRNKGRAQHILNGKSGRIDRDLGDEAQLLSGGDMDLAGIGGQLPRQQAEQRRLAAAVAAHDADAFALVNVKAQSVQQGLADLKGLDQLVYRNIDHRSSP